MKIVDSFPRAVREIDTAWIPLSDGTRLAARIWLPVDADARPVPAILEYIPYRRRDGTIIGDAPMHRYFAGHGYAGVRVETRTQLTATADSFLLTASLDAYEGETRIFARTWQSRIPRDLV